MATDVTPGQTIRVKISKNINRASARKTLERIFRQDKSLSQTIDAREANFIKLPKRRGGCIWTKLPNKLHLPLDRGNEATIRATPQCVRDLRSVSAFVEVSAQ